MAKPAKDIRQHVNQHYPTQQDVVWFVLAQYPRRYTKITSQRHMWRAILYLAKGDLAALKVLVKQALDNPQGILQRAEYEQRDTGSVQHHNFKRPLHRAEKRRRGIWERLLDYTYDILDLFMRLW